MNMWFTTLMVTGCLGSAIVSASEQADDMPPIFSAFLDNPRYKYAADAAQNAVLSQTILPQQYRKFKNQVYDQTLKKMELTTRHYIDSRSPIKADAIFFVVGAGYLIGARQRIVQGFNNPFFKDVRHTIGYSFKDHSVSTEIVIPFP